MEMRTIEMLEMEAKEIEDYVIYSLEEEEQEKVEVLNLKTVCEFVDIFPEELPGLPLQERLSSP